MWDMHGGRYKEHNQLTKKNTNRINPGAVKKLGRKSKNINCLMRSFVGEKSKYNQILARIDTYVTYNQHRRSITIPTTMIKSYRVIEYGIVFY